MNRRERRAAATNLRQENKQQPDQLVAVPNTEWPRKEKRLEAVFRSNKFLVQVYDEDNGIVRLSVCRTEINKAGDWSDRITWDELQEIKRQCCFGNFDAVEIYPQTSDVVNVANMRHLWVLPNKLDFAWRKQ